MAALRARYLAAYNLAQFLGWGAVLGQSVAALIRAPSSVYAAAGPTVRTRPLLSFRTACSLPRASQ